MSEAIAIPMFSPLWWGGIGPVLACIAVGLTMGRGLTREQIGAVSTGLAVVGLVRLPLAHGWWVSAGVWNIQEYLPLHMCSLSFLFAIALLLWPRQLLYEFVYYWGISGTLHALVTPALTLGLGPIEVFDHFFSHGYTMFVALWATFVMGMSPRPGSWWRVLLWTQLVLPVIGGINWLLGANYMFLRAPPPADNPFIMGEFPWHILGYQFAAALHLLLLYLPWAWRRRATAPATA